MIRDIIDTVVALSFYSFMAMGGYTFFKFVQTEALYKVKKGHPSLHEFTKGLTGKSFDYYENK